MSNAFVVRKRFVVIDTADGRVIATFSTEAEATEHARKLNGLRRMR